MTRRSPEETSKRQLFVAAGVLSAAVVLWELFLLVTAVTPTPLSPGRVLKLLFLDGVFATLLALPALWSGRALSRRWAPKNAFHLIEVSLSTLIFLGLLVPSAWLREQLVSMLAPTGGALAPEAGFLCTAGDGARAGVEVGFGRLFRLVSGSLLLQAPVLPVLGALALLRSPQVRARLTTRRAAIVALAVAAPVVAIGVTRPDSEPVIQPLAVEACPTGAPTRVYNVSAIHVRIPLNRFGDFEPNGFMYVLDENLAAVRAQETRAFPARATVGLRKDAIQPLVIRANLGECLEIRFTNRLDDGPAALHVLGLAHTVENGAGMTGFNPDTFAQPGQTVTYRLPMPSDPHAERAYYFHDGGASRQRVAHGLFGALIAEPAGSQHLDTETGLPLSGSNWEAIIVPPTGPAFREFTVVYHEVGDETYEALQNGAGLDALELVADFLDIYRPGTRALNYRSEPFERRLQLEPDESLAYGSYTFGDPATPIPRSYLGDPAKTRLLHAGSEVFHVHHLHGGATRWRLNPKAGPSDFADGLDKHPDSGGSTRRDSQTIGPGVSFSLEHECGSGGCQQAAGDFLYHCHIGHHYLGGMWSFWRVFDTLQEDLAPLPGRAPPPEAVTSVGLVGREVEGKTLVPRASLTDPSTEHALEDFIERQLPPPGVRFDRADATVWDWTWEDTQDGPLYLGEPEDTAVWANFASPTPGARAPILFNPQNGRYAWPLFRPHLGKRPPFAGAGHTGAPWLGTTGTALRRDGLCPTDEVLVDPLRKTRLFPMTSISAPIRVSPTQIDQNGMVYVLNDDKQPVLSGAVNPEPLVIRTNAGDCAQVMLTNEMTQITEFGEVTKTNLHTHFVQFDPQASDGVVTGMSYEQGIYPYRLESRTLTSAVSANATRLPVTNVSRLRPGIWIGVGLGRGLCAGPGGGEQFCTEVRRIEALEGNTIVLEEPLELAHAAGESVGVEFVRHDWFSDVSTGTVFFHTHIDWRFWPHGMFGMHLVEPRGSTHHHPVTGAELRSGAIADIHVPPGGESAEGITGSFREVALALGEYVSNAIPVDANDIPILPAATVNLRAQPLASRLLADPARAFSSVRHGDPNTPLPRAYVGDPMLIRLLGVHENGAALRLSGMRVPTEENLISGAGMGDTILSGVSERSDIPVRAGAGEPSKHAGDFLYYNSISRYWQAGAWGLIRFHDTLRADLRPLPDRAAPQNGLGFPQLGFTGQNPPPAVEPGQPCPADAPLRRYDVRVQRVRIEYQPDERDSNGVAFRLEDGSDPDDRPTVAEPLILRVNAGECLEINLRNHWSRPASFHLAELVFHPQGSYGAAIGFNPDSTVAPGGARLYRFYAAAETGVPMALNLADPTSGARGGYAAVVVEPAGSTWRHPVTGAPLRSGAVADIISPDHRFREAVLLFAEEDDRIGASDMPYPKDVRGATGINYAATPLADRDLERAPWQALSSAEHGDPRLVIHAHVGDQLVFRVGQPHGEQKHVFAVQGHRLRFDDLLGAEQAPTKQFAPGMSFYAWLMGGAGGDLWAPGDYLFLDQRMPFMEAGLWGILRVHPEGAGGILPLYETQEPEPDGGVPDSGVPDSGVPDSGVPDGGDDTIPPGPVTKLTLVPDVLQITLSFDQPADAATVRILRSTVGFATSPDGGASQVMVLDEASTGVEVDFGLIDGVRYFYTVFARDAAGNFSTAATASEIAGLPFPPELSLSTPHVDFGSEAVGTVATGEVTVINTGGAPLVISSVIRSAGSTAFTVNGTNCTSAAVAPNGFCTFSVTFAPTTTGAHTGTVRITSNASGSPHSVALRGNATGGKLALSDGALDFGRRTIGTSKERVLTIRNTGTVGLTLGSMSLMDSLVPGASADYTVGTCPPVLGPKARCALRVTFAPSLAGSRNAVLRLQTSAGNATVLLVGSGKAHNGGRPNGRPVGR